MTSHTRIRLIFVAWLITILAVLGVLGSMLDVTYNPDWLSTLFGAAPDTSATTASPPAAATTGAAVSEPLDVIVPVLGVTADDLRDSFDAARSGDRTHDAIDIMAAEGTRVLAAADGRIVRLDTSNAGGIGIYQLSTDESIVYYYAHLLKYDDGLRQGMSVAQGDVIGLVGMTGNATTPHLHFAIWRTDDPTRFWSGPALNPYEVLTGEQ